MSTRGCYRFSDKYGTYTVFKHMDNYPYTEHGGVAAIAKALPYAWPLPRFEADEFAAAFVAAHKVDQKERVSKYGNPALMGGNVRLMNTPSEGLDYMPGDIEYLYDVSWRWGNGASPNTALPGTLWVCVYDISGGFDVPLETTLMAEGPLEQMLEQFKEFPDDDK